MFYATYFFKKTKILNNFFCLKFIVQIWNFQRKKIKDPSESRGLCKLLHYRKLISRFAIVWFVSFFHQFTCQSFVFTVLDRRRLFIKFTFFVLTNNSFFLYHSFETFDCFFQILGLINTNRCHLFSPPS